MSTATVEATGAHPQFPKMFEPLQVAHVTLKNRILMGSMHTGLEEPGMFSTLDEMAAFYGERARGECGLIVTGGISPNAAGVGFVGASKMNTKGESAHHKVITDAVHDNGGLIAMQILHTGRYGYHWWTVSASAIKAPIGWSVPKALTSKEVYTTIDDFAKCALLAKEAGYDGVEVMGSEGYFINQFLVQRTNHRTDEWGGSYTNRMRLPVEIVKAARAAVGPDFVIIFRLSMLDLVEGGSSWDEVVELATELEAAGVSVLNTGIGWHEARVPTIATSVPRGGFTWVTKKMKEHVSIPLCTTNRVNMPGTAEDVLQSGSADLISMARPFLADPDLVKKAREGRVDEINTCIGCNQACLDHIFVAKRASCLVNPRACYETTLQISPVATEHAEKIAVVGAGPAGLSAATTAAERGHHVTLFDKAAEIGGQFNMAKVIPGKEEFQETIRYFGKRLELTGVDVRLNTEVKVSDLADFDSVVVATGVVPREVKNLQTTGSTQVVSYIDILKGKVTAGDRVCIVGAGGIGFDVAEYLTHVGPVGGKIVNKDAVDNEKVSAFLKDWNIDTDISAGGLLSKDVVDAAAADAPTPVRRHVTLLQRKKGRLGKSLGKTTGWIHRASIKKHGVVQRSGVNYVEVTDEGLVVEEDGKRDTIPCDTVVLCAGQVRYREIYEPLKDANRKVFSIGGALQAGELDAKRAIDQGTRLAALIENAKARQVFTQPQGSVTKSMMDFATRMKGGTPTS